MEDAIWDEFVSLVRQSETNELRLREIEIELSELNRKREAIYLELRRMCKGKNRDRIRAEIRKRMFKRGYERPLRI